MAKRYGGHSSAIATSFFITCIALLITGADSEFFGETDRSSVTVTATEAAAQGAPVAGVSQTNRIEEWVRSPACTYGGYRHDLNPGCISEAYEISVDCSDGTSALAPWWMRYRRSNGTWSAWSMIGWYQCPADMLRTAIENAWARMPITPNTIHIQPDTGWVLTTAPTIVYVDRTPRTMNTTLLGTAVTIRATASAYTWTWGDGSAPTVTTQPGAAYPNHTVSHTYLHFEGPATVGLRTTWTGSYTIDGGATWRSAPGTASTTSTPIAITVYNPHGHRVDCDLVGNCLTGADGPSSQ